MRESENLDARVASCREVQGLSENKARRAPLLGIVDKVSHPPLRD